MKLALFKYGSVVFEPPHGNVARLAGGDRDNHVGKRRPRGMVGMRVIEPEKLATKLAPALFGQSIVRRPHQKSSARSLLGRVGQRHGRLDAVAPPHQRTAAFMRIRFFAVTPDLVLEGRSEAQSAIRHRRSRTSRSNTFLPRRETP